MPGKRLRNSDWCGDARLLAGPFRGPLSGGDLSFCVEGLRELFRGGVGHAFFVRSRAQSLAGRRPQEGAIFRARFEGLESYTFVALGRRLAELCLLVFLLRVPFVLS